MRDRCDLTFARIRFAPAGDVEKEKLFQLSVQVARFYSLDLLSFVCMSNHWHAVCAAPAEPPARDEVIANWRAAKGKLAIEPNWDDAETVAHLGARMRDISCFVKDLQQRFTCWFNRTRLKRRRGGLWADRFKGVVAPWIAHQPSAAGHQSTQSQPVAPDAELDVSRYAFAPLVCAARRSRALWWPSRRCA